MDNAGVSFTSTVNSGCILLNSSDSNFNEKYKISLELSCFTHSHTSAAYSEFSLSFRLTRTTNFFFWHTSANSIGVMHIVPFLFMNFSKEIPWLSFLFNIGFPRFISYNFKSQ